MPRTMPRAWLYVAIAAVLSRPYSIATAARYKRHRPSTGERQDAAASTEDGVLQCGATTPLKQVDPNAVVDPGRASTMSVAYIKVRA